MEVLVTQSEVNIKASGFNRIWKSFLSIDNKYCLYPEAAPDLTKEGIPFTLEDCKFELLSAVPT